MRCRKACRKALETHITSRQALSVLTHTRSQDMPEGAETRVCEDMSSVSHHTMYPAISQCTEKGGVSSRRSILSHCTDSAFQTSITDSLVTSSDPLAPGRTPMLTFRTHTLDPFGELSGASEQVVFLPHKNGSYHFEVPWALTHEVHWDQPTGIV